MRKGFLGAVTGILAGAGAMQAQAPALVPATDAAPAICALAKKALVNSMNCPPEVVIKADPSAGPRVWGKSEYLLWWIKDSNLPPLVTTGSPADTNPGALGQPGTQVLFGGSVDNEERSGGRFTIGAWLDDRQTIGVEGRYFFLGQRAVRFNKSSDGTTVLGRPFFDVTPGSAFENMENVDLLAFPGVAAGSATATLSSRLQGAEANLLFGALSDETFRVSLLAGFRYLHLGEDLQFGETTTFLPTVPVFGGAALLSSSTFDTRNDFYGGQLGAAADWNVGRLFVDVRGQVGLGSNHQQVGINGTTTAVSPVGIVNTIAGGPFARASNIGQYSRDRFAVAPEVGVNVGYQVADFLRVSVGYTFLYWTHVVRPGDQIDRAENLSQIPPPVGPGMLMGPSRPAFTGRDTDFWAQGINFAIEFSY